LTLKEKLKEIRNKKVAIKGLNLTLEKNEHRSGKVTLFGSPNGGNTPKGF
jgi:hypothetical protein